MLDLEHQALVGYVRQVSRLGDKPVEAGAFELMEPLLCNSRVGRTRGAMDRWSRSGQCSLQPRPPLFVRRLAQVGVFEGEEIEGDERGRHLGCQQVDA